MKIVKPHFWYNKRQRSGVFFLVLIIILLQVAYFFLDFTSDEILDSNNLELISFQKKIDSLKIIELEKRKPKKYKFNPNFISDYRGEQLGMSIQEIDRLHEYRSKNKYVNSIAEFQKVTKVSDSLLDEISPYFKFPEWVMQKQTKQTTTFINTKINTYKEPKIHQEIVQINVNTASFKEVLKIPGIDYELCVKIFEYRDEVAELQDISELKNIEGFPLEKYNRIIVYLTAK